MLKRLRLMWPVIFRLILICCVSLAIAGLLDPIWGTAVLIAGLFLEIFMHLNYIVRLAQWLEDPEAQAPSVRSALWSEIFYRVSSSRKALQTNTRRLQDREQRYRKTLAALPEGIVLVKTDWAVSWCNEAAEKVFGIRGEADTGRHFFAFIKNDSILSYLKAGRFEEAFTWRMASGKALELRVVVVDRKNAIVVTRDISEQERLDAMRRDFVANVSHELRTPLTVLMGFLDMALHGLDDTNKSRVVLQTAHLSLMREQADRMQRLINDLLTLSRLETGGSDKTHEVFSLSDLVETIAEEISVMAAKTHTVKTDIAASIWITGYCDEIRSAIVNLMTNAVRYTPAGGTIRLVCAVREDGAIIVSVADNGIGIAQKDIPRLTERFYRVDKSRSRETGGTGLGLAIVKHALLHHNARLQIDSVLGKGSTFTVVLPPTCRARDPEALESAHAASQELPQQLPEIALKHALESREEKAGVKPLTEPQPEPQPASSSESPAGPQAK